MKIWHWRSQLKNVHFSVDYSSVILSWKISVHVYLWVWSWYRIETLYILSWIRVKLLGEYILKLKLDKNSPPIPVESMSQQVERRIGISKVRVQIPLESTFFSWLRQCQIIMKKYYSYISLWMILKRSNFVGQLCCMQHCLIVCYAIFIEHFRLKGCLNYVCFRSKRDPTFWFVQQMLESMVVCPTKSHCWKGGAGNTSQSDDQLATCFSTGEVDIYVKNHTKQPGMAKVMKVWKDSDNENSISHDESRPSLRAGFVHYWFMKIPRLFHDHIYKNPWPGKARNNDTSWTGAPSNHMGWWDPVSELKCRAKLW